MEPTWLAWMRKNMPPDLFDQYLVDNMSRTAHEDWAIDRIKELENAIKGITEEWDKIRK